MSIAGRFIQRPVMTTLLMLAILLFGLMAYRSLPVSDLPNVDRATISVSASLPGASPETMAASVATPLEKQFSTIAGIDSMISTSSQGSTQITIQFNLDRDIDAAAQDVQAAIARTVRQLPPEMPAPPTYRKVNPADQPILFIALTSPTLPLATLDEYGETQMAQRISMVDGVAQVMIFGSQKRAVRIQLDPKELAFRGIGINEVANAIDLSNVNLPTGFLYGPHRAFTVQASGQLMEADDYRSLVVAYRNGAPVRLESLGRVFDSVENDKTAAWFCTSESQERSIVLAVQRQPGTNTVEVADNVKEVLGEIQDQLPPSVSAIILRDNSVNIRESARDVQITLLVTLALVVVVIFLFLRNLSATIIPSLALPMSVIGTFTVMYALNYSLDNLSLMALTLCVGFVVDDAIVMLENIVRHMEMGKPRMQAALDGAGEVGFTIVSMTLSLAAVFIPVIFMGGLVGRLFREFAVTIGAAVLISGFVSLTLTPMLSSRFIRPPGEVRHGRIYRASERVFKWMIRFYDVTLRVALRHRPTTFLSALAVLGGSIYLFYASPWDFIPSEDRDMLMIGTKASQGISYKSMFEHQQALARVVQQDPNVLQFMSNAGGGFGSGANTGMMLLLLKPRTERDLSADQVAQELRPKLASVPGIQAFPANPPVINLGGRRADALYQYTLLGPDTDELYDSASRLLERLKAVPQLQDVSSDMQLQNPQLEVNLDRDQASALGVSATEVESVLNNAYGSRQVSTIYAPNNDYQVIMEMLPEYQLDPAALSLLYVRSSFGPLVPIDAVAERKEDVGPLSINHSGQLPAVTLSFNLAPGATLSQALDEVNKAARETLPATISTGFQGTAQAFEQAKSGLWLLLALAIVVIYMVLGILYENFFHPVTILSALPFAAFGAVLTLAVFHTPLSLYAFVGIIMLVGLVKKNGIMMIDFAVVLQRGGKSPAESIHEACLIRFRPIMMTTLCALMAGLPIALGWGAGAESRQPLGLAVVGGLLFSQTLTLYVTPVFYLYMESLQNLLRKWFGPRPPGTAHQGWDGAPVTNPE